MVKKVKCTFVQALKLCTGRTAHRGGNGITLLFLDHGTRRGEGSASRPGRSLLPAKDPDLLYRRMGGPQGWSRHVRKIFNPPDRPARSQSLYRLSYPVPQSFMSMCQILSDESSTAVWIYKYKRNVNGNKEREHGYCYFVLALNLTFEWQVCCTEMTKFVKSLRRMSKIPTFYFNVLCSSRGKIACCSSELIFTFLYAGNSNQKLACNASRVSTFLV